MTFSDFNIFRKSPQKRKIEPSLHSDFVSPYKEIRGNFLAPGFACFWAGCIYDARRLFCALRTLWDHLGLVSDWNYVQREDFGLSKLRQRLSWFLWTRITQVISIFLQVQVAFSGISRAVWRRQTVKKYPKWAPNTKTCWSICFSTPIEPSGLATASIRVFLNGFFCAVFRMSPNFKSLCESSFILDGSENATVLNQRVSLWMDNILDHSLEKWGSILWPLPRRIFETRNGIETRLIRHSWWHQVVPNAPRKQSTAFTGV